MINGLPGVGKTTTGASLAKVMSARFLSKDVFKEHLAHTQNAIPPAQLGAVASELMWARASALSGLVVVESWWYSERDVQYAANGLRRSGAERGVEVWCSGPTSVIRERYRRRCRDPVHRDQERLATDWELWARHARALSIVPVITVDTTAAVDAPALAKVVRGALSMSSLIQGGPPSTTGA